MILNCLLIDVSKYLLDKSLISEYGVYTFHVKVMAFNTHI